jgi:Holliday junction resolvase RusA-like endonuclease
MKSLTITIPHPPLPCRPNSRTHWRKKAQAVKAYRIQAFAYANAVLAAYGHKPPRWDKARVRVVWRCTKRIYPDPDNIIASLKAAFDGLADAGVVSDDKGLWPERPIVETGRHWPEVEITVEGEI